MEHSICLINKIQCFSIDVRQLINKYFETCGSEGSVCKLFVLIKFLLSNHDKKQIIKDKNWLKSKYLEF